MTRSKRLSLSNMSISIIAATGKKNELGKGNQLLWHLPDDLKHFKELTTGHTIVMGRKTFESIGKPLPNRRNIVITRDMNFTADGIEVIHSLQEIQNRDEEIFIIGGGEIYAQALPFADKLYLTEVDASLDADTFFPQFKKNEWNEVERTHHNKKEKHLYDFDFVVYEKI